MARTTHARRLPCGRTPRHITRRGRTSASTPQRLSQRCVMEPSFDFERGLDPNAGQPSRPPADMPAAGRKNYRMVRTAHARAEQTAGSRLPRPQADSVVFPSPPAADRVSPLASGPVHERQRVRLPAPVRGGQDARLPVLLQVWGVQGVLGAPFTRPPSVDSHGPGCALAAPAAGAGLPVQALQRRHKGASPTDGEGTTFAFSDPVPCPHQDCNMYKLGFCIHGPQWCAPLPLVALLGA